MFKLSGGVAGIAGVGTSDVTSSGSRFNLPSMSNAFDSPTTWSWIFFGLSVGWLALVYFGSGGIKGDVAS